MATPCSKCFTMHVGGACEFAVVEWTSEQIYYFVTGSGTAGSSADAAESGNYTASASASQPVTGIGQAQHRVMASICNPTASPITVRVSITYNVTCESAPSGDPFSNNCMGWLYEINNSGDPVGGPTGASSVAGTSPQSASSSTHYDYTVPALGFRSVGFVVQAYSETSDSIPGSTSVTINGTFSVAVVP